MFDRILCVVGSASCIDECKWDDYHGNKIDLENRSCVPHRLVQIANKEWDNRKVSNITKCASARNDKIYNTDKFVKAKQMKHCSHSSRIFFALNQLKCWRDDNEYGCHNWDYPMFIDTEHSLTSDLTHDSELLSSVEDKGGKKFVTWADDEGLELVLIHHIRSLLPFPFERIEI
jgi:hypothetical protein